MGEHDVMETAKAWKLPTLTAGKENTPVSVARTILGREIPLDQVLKILSEGKSDLMKGFISQRTKRPFDAYLVFNAKLGKIGFNSHPGKEVPCQESGRLRQECQREQRKQGKEGKPKAK